MISLLISIYRKIIERIDLPFLIFLLTISSNKIYLKVAALVLIFVLRPKFDFIFNKKISWFYPALIILSLIQFIFFGHDFSFNHWLVFLIGIFYWFMCYAYMYQTYLFVSLNSFTKINATIATFLYLNFTFCILNYLEVCYKAQTLLPFLQYSGDYGASTGDYICGLFGVPSYINAIVCSLFAIYFLHHKKMNLFLIATFSALLSFANIISLVFIGFLILYFFVAGDNKKRVFVVISILLCFGMYFFISPDNYNYIKKTVGLSVNNEVEIMPEVIMEDKNKSSNLDSLPTRVKYVNDSNAASQKIRMFDRALLFNKSYDLYTTYHPVDIKSSPGKKIAILQTVNFLKSDVRTAMFGAGIGNFSSRLAYQFSGRDSSRLFMRLPKYAHGYYFKNNLLIYDSMRQLPTEYHSIKHFPNNFLSQLLGEYGLLGLVLFLTLYLYFFYKRSINKFFFLIILLPVSAYLMLDYLYEFFNVMVIVEMLLFINCKKDDSSEIQTEVK